MLTSSDLTAPVLACLDDVAMPMTEDQLCAATGLRPLGVRLALWALEREKRVEHTDRGWRRRRF